jgi:hypothetical protein
VSGGLNHANYKIYYTDTLQDEEEIVENIKAMFLNCRYIAVKMQLRFGVF